PTFDPDLLRAYIKKLLFTNIHHTSWTPDRDQVKAWMKEISQRVKERMLEIQPHNL
ncbi:hypothetical protein BJ138DRAFT_985634, partial [Hygrophoropsis aurantiaca]